MESLPRTAADLARHAASIRRVAGALVRDLAEAEDVSQDALRAALERPDAAQRSLGGWLVGAGRRLAAARARGEARRRGRERDVARVEAQPSAAERAAGLEVAERMVALVRALPDSQAEVVWLRFWEDLPPRDIAARLGIGVEAVKTRLKRGLATLRSELDAETPGGREAWLGALAPLVLVPLPTPGTPPLTSETVSTVASTSPALAGMSLVLLVKKLALVVLVAASLVGGFLLLDGDEVAAPSLTGLDPAADDVGVADAEREELAVPESEPALGSRSEAETEHAVAPPRLEVRVVREFDGSPLSGVRVAVIERDLPALDSVGRAAVTDGDGTVRFGGLAGGSVRLVTDRGTRLDVDVARSGRTKVELQVPHGVRIRGVVLDPADQPVADASVLLQRHTTVFAWTDVARAATTGADGRFELVDVVPDACLGARASGFAPSDLEELRHRALGAGDELDLTLRLAGAGGGARGVVRGPDGAPVEGALVWVAQRSTLRAPTVRGVSTSSGELAVTDANGVFEREDLELGSAHVVVAAAGFAREATTISVGAAGEPPAEIRLQAAIGLDGRVLGADGRGLADVTVRLERVGSRYAQDYDPLDFPRARTDAGGHFHFEELPSGRVELTGFVRGIEDLPAELILAPGERGEVELRVPGGLVLTGRASEPNGTPIASEIVRVEGPDGWASDINTDAEGRFRFEGVPDGPLVVHLYPISRGWTLPAVTMKDVRAADSPIEIVWEGADALGVVRGRFVDAGEWVRAGDRVLAQLVRGNKFSDEIEIDLADGRFRFAGVPAGEGYRVNVGARDQVVLATESFAVEAGRAVELPDLRTAAPARLRVEVVTADPKLWVTARLIDLGSEMKYHETVTGDGELVFERVPAGSWTLLVGARGCAKESFATDLLPGQTASRNVALQPVEPTWLHLTPEPPTSFRTMCRTWRIDGDSEVLVDQVKGNVTHFPVFLRPGSYRCELVDLFGGGALVGKFEIPVAASIDAAGAEQREVTVELVPR